MKVFITFFPGLHLQVSLSLFSSNFCEGLLAVVGQVSARLTGSCGKGPPEHQFWVYYTLCRIQSSLTVFSGLHEKNLDKIRIFLLTDGERLLEFNTRYLI